MRKIVTIAASEFQTAVRSKAFLIGMALLPLIVIGSVLMQRAAGSRVDLEERRFAVIDGTGRLYPMLAQAATLWNAKQVDGERVKGPRFLPSEVRLDGRSADAVRLELSDRIRQRELFAFVEIPPAVLTGDAPLRYHSDHSTYEALPDWLEQVVTGLVMIERLRASNVDPSIVGNLTRRVRLDALGVLGRDARGGLVEATRIDRVRSLMVPAALMLLMFMIVISTASPLLNSVLEEKMTRISEVLLGSVTPFQLMMGKLSGCVAVSIVLAAVYLTGVFGLATYHGYGDAVSPAQGVWFFAYLVLAMFTYGALFIAIGAASTDLKDAQGLMTPVMIIFMTPVFFWVSVLRAPESTMSVIASIAPFAAPVLMTLRLSLRPGPALWQILVSFGVTAIVTVVLVWAAGRIFRVGILMQGKSASAREVMRWVRAA